MQASRSSLEKPPSAASGNRDTKSAQAGELRIATFNACLTRPEEGQLLNDLRMGTEPQISNIAEIIQRVRPDILLLNEFDYVADGSAVAAFQTNFLENSQNGAEPIHYPHRFFAECNTGIASGMDLNRDGHTDGPADAFGFGRFPGQYAMLLMSRYPILTHRVRTFQTFLWKDLPSARLPRVPANGEPWFSPEKLRRVRLSSKSHWDLPVNFDGNQIHLLASHPTPPVFDGDERRNGLRNHDEIRFWRDYVDPARAGYIYDDKGRSGGLANNSRFVILGDLNASPSEGDSIGDPIGSLLASPYINGAVVPTSAGGRQADADNPYAAMHTADWKMRADYVLPSVYGLRVADAGVFWPPVEDPLHRLVGPGRVSSDHRLVYLDLVFSE